MFKNKISIILPLVTMALFGLIQIFDPASGALPFYCLVVSVLVAIEAGAGAPFVGIVIAGLFVIYALAIFPASASSKNSVVYVQHLAILTLPFCGFAIGLLICLFRALIKRAGLAKVIAHEANQELRSLREAMDCSKDGIAVLDGDMRMQFANQVYRRLFNYLPGDVDQKPTYQETVSRVMSQGIYEVDPSYAATFVTDRVAFVRSGNPVPVLLRLTGGSKIRFTCGALPDGGRMLNYTDVTDMVEEAERLEELANLDGMTGLANRRQLNLIAERDFERARRENTPLSMIILDIDRFKAVNDEHGHDVGDRAICHVANICRDSKRGTDLAARIGGEEFVILLPDTHLKGALVISQRIRKRVEANPLIINGKPLNLSVSLGVAEADGACADFAQLMKVSDQLLYQAKEQGRNRVVSALDKDHLPKSVAA